jgi:RNA polymerase sigma factor (sigma-70 family)
MRHDQSGRTWVDPGGGDDEQHEHDEGAEASSRDGGEDNDGHRVGHGAGGRDVEIPTDGNTASVLSRRSYPPPDFLLEGLSGPDEDQRHAEWLKFHKCFYDRLMDTFARDEPDYDRRSDLVQRVFIRAYRAIVINGRPLRTAEKAFPWLKKIGRNLLYDLSDADMALAKMMGIHGSHLIAEESLQTHAENALDRLEREDPYDEGRFPVDAKTFRTRVAALSERDQTILRLRTDQELDWEAVAKEVSMSPESARQRYHRLRERLQRP